MRLFAGPLPCRMAGRLIVGAGLALALARAEGGPASSELASLSLEDLMHVQVTSVTRKGQSLSRAAAATFVISREDIRRSGAQVVPELLRMVPGLTVSRLDGNKIAWPGRTVCRQSHRLGYQAAEKAKEPLATRAAQKRDHVFCRHLPDRRERAGHRPFSASR